MVQKEIKMLAERQMNRDRGWGSSHERGMVRVDLECCRAVLILYLSRGAHSDLAV